MRRDIEGEAASGLIRIENGDATPEEIARFRAWREADPRHEAACRRLEIVWSRAGLLTRIRPPDSEVDPDLLEPHGLERVTAHVGAFFAEPHPALKVVAPFLIAGLVLWLTMLSALGTTYATDSYDAVSYTLEDNSTMMLEPSSKARVRFTEERRTVDLRQGKAHFDVVRDTHRPFEVNAGPLQLIVRGTQFSVETRDPRRVEAEVTEGRVELALQEPDSEAPCGDFFSKLALTAGERIVLTPERARIWASPERVMNVYGRPLHDVICEVNLFHDRQLHIEDRSLADMSVDMDFEVHDLDGFVSDLGAFGIRSQERDGEILLFR